MAEGAKQVDSKRRLEFKLPANSSSPSSRQRKRQRTTFIIGVGGGTASGKTSVCEKIIQKLGQHDLSSEERQVVILSQDSFYKDLTKEQLDEVADGCYNFDHPDAFDNELMKEKLDEIVQGNQVEIPIYDFKTHSRLKETRILHSVDVVLFEGILVLYDPDVRDMMQLKLFVDTDSDTRLARRVVRDIETRERKLEQVLEQYITFVKPAFEEFTLPTKKYADVIIPRGVENDVAINLIVQHIQDILSGKVTQSTRKRIRRQSDSVLSARPH